MDYFEAYQSCSLFGALRYFANIEDSVCVINGPSGCSFYARNAVVNLNGFFESLSEVKIPHIFTVDFTEKDVIFGNEERLERALSDIIQKYQPKLIVVFNCCVSEIIGTDIDQIAKDLSERENNTKVIAVHSAGFKGDQRHGMKLAAQLLFDNIFQKRIGQINTVKDKVNILGDFDYFNRSTKELVEKLKKIGISNITQVPGSCSIDELYAAPDASLNIITCQNASRYLAELMKAKFGIPYIGKGFDLYGLDNCFKSYLSLYQFFGKDTLELEQEYKETKDALNSYKSILAGKHAIIVAGTRRSLGYAAILKELGMNVDLIFCENIDTFIKREEYLRYSENVLLNVRIDDLAYQIKRINPDIILTTLPEMVAPNQYIPRLSDDFAGFSGCLRMAEYISNYSQSGQENKMVAIKN